MPVSARKLVYDFNRKLNAFNTSTGQKYSIVDCVSAINEAWEVIYENNVKLAEKDSFKRNTLRQLEIKNSSLKFKEVDGNYFVTYPKDLYHRLNHYVIASGVDDCKGQEKMIVPRIVQSDDLHKTRLDPYWKANFAWEQLPMDEAQNGFWLYTDGKMEIKKVVIDYYKRLTYIQAPSLVSCPEHVYEDYDARLITSDVDFEVDSTYLARKVVDVAVFMAHRDTQDTTGFQTQLQKISVLENMS